MKFYFVHFYLCYILSDIESPLVADIAETLITLQWNEPPPELTGNPQRNITYYAITISSQDGEDQQFASVPAEAAVYNITGLQMATTYDIGINVVIDTEGQGEQTYDLGVPPFIVTTREYSDICMNEYHVICKSRLLKECSSN